MTDNTPLNADDELREKLNSLFESVFSQGVRAGKDVATETYEDFDAWHKKGELDEAMQLITADRKRVALEARIDCLKRLPTVTTNFMNNGAVSVVVLKNEIDRRIAELKAQQEEL